MPEQGSRFVPEGGKQVDIIDRAKDFIAEGRQCGGGQVEKEKTGGGREFKHDYLHLIDFKWIICACFVACYGEVWKKVLTSWIFSSYIYPAFSAGLFMASKH
ncbi:hypothetical protein CIFRMM251M_20325 [Citrobacter freundii]